MLWRGPFGGGAASGKLGMMVASHNTGGQYLRARTVPTNPSTPQQVEVRNAISALSPAYNDLTDAQRTAWAQYGTAVGSTNRLGDVVPISGIAAFIRANSPRLQAGLARVDNAPSVNTAGDPGVGLIAVNTDTHGTFTFATIPQNYSAETSATAVLIYTGRGQNAAINFFKGPYRLAATLVGPATTGGFDFAFPLSGDQTLPWRYQITRSDGRLSPSQGAIFRP